MSLTVHPAWSAFLSLLQLLSQHWLSHLLCLWILLRKTWATPCLDCCQKASSNHFRASSTAFASRFICVLRRSLWSGAYLLTSSSSRWLMSEKWLRVSIRHLWPEKLFLILPLLSPPSDLAAFINVMMQICHSLYIISTSWSEPMGSV